MNKVQEDNKVQEEVVKVKTTIRLPKTLVKQLKRYALDNDINLVDVIMKASTQFLVRNTKKRNEQSG